MQHLPILACSRSSPSASCSRAGAYFRDFSIRPEQVVLTFAAGLLTQAASWMLTPSKPRTLRSAIITGLSLTLLLRADNLWAHPAAAAAISSKSLIRVRGKHLFNPATFGVMFAIILLPGAWVSPGQWGQDVALAGWMIALGAFVATRARRADISWSFLAFYVGALALRIAYLGQRWAVLDASADEWRTAAVRFLHDFRSDDLAQSPAGARSSCGDRRRDRVHLAVRILRAQRNALGAVSRRALGAAVGRDLACAEISNGNDPKWILEDIMKAKLGLSVPMLAMLALCAIARPPDAHAFCGFYVGKADSNLFNHASQVVMVRHGDKSVLSLMNDYQGEPSDFALVVPVPQVLQKEQIHIGDREIFKKLDQYSSPRLVEYFDPNPCELDSRRRRVWGSRASTKLHRAEASRAAGQRARRHRSRHNTPSANTTSSSCRPSSPTGSKPGCRKTATRFPSEHIARSNPTSARI